MPGIFVAPRLSEVAEQYLELSGLQWDQYITISNALPEKPGLRLTYLNGRLTFLTISRNHDWISRTLGYLIVAVANGLDLLWEPTGSATYRREDLLAGSGRRRDVLFRLSCRNYERVREC